MAKVYVEARPKGLPEDSAITDYVVEDSADKILKTTSTQKEAIDWAKANGHSPVSFGKPRARVIRDRLKPKSLLFMPTPAMASVRISPGTSRAALAGY